MSSRWYGVRVVATDPARLARWWAEVLGYQILDERPNRVTVGPGPGHPRLSFAPADELGAGGALHLDITVDDTDIEVERLVNMGARPVEERSAGSLVLADPEGNQFTLARTAEVAVAPAA
jgi:hypothetical protein